MIGTRCQVFKRYLPDREPEVAVVLPNALVGGSAHDRSERLRELDVRQWPQAICALHE